MTTSGTTSFSVSRDDLIKGALRKIGVVAQGEVASADQISEASVALNMMVKAWEADGMPLWALRTTPITVTANKTSYVIGPSVSSDVVTDKPLKVIQAWNRDPTSKVDIPMRIITKQEYAILGNKATTGKPIQIYYEPKIDNGTLYLFPTPAAGDVATSTIYITYQRPFEDFNSTTDTPDFPSEWIEAIVYGLAVRLASEYGLPLDQRMLLTKEADKMKESALGFGTEEGSLFLGVERRGW